MANEDPYAQFLDAPAAAAPAADNQDDPYAQFLNDPGGTSDILHGAERGALDIPNMAAKTGAYIGHATHAIGAAVGSDTLEDLGSEIAARASAMADATQGGAATAQSAPGTVGGIIRRNAYGVGEGLGQMGTAAVAGAATGAAIGSIVPGAGTVAGALVGSSIAMLAALPALFAGSTAESTFERVQAAQEAAGPTTQANENTALEAGAATGAVAGVGQAVLSKIGVGKMLQPVLDKVGAAAEGSIVQSALQSTLGGTLKGVGAAAAEGGLVNAAQQAGIQEIDSQYGVGNGPTLEGTADAAVQGAGITALTHGASSVVQSAQVSNTAKLLADPTANPNDRANAALGAAAIIATKSPEVAQDFGLYAQQQILAGQPIEVAPDAFYNGVATQIKQQQDAQDAQANRTTSGDFPSFVPTGDEAAANAPAYVTDPNVAPPAMAAPLGLLDESGRTTANQVPNFVPTGDEAAAFAPAHVTAPSITDTISGIMSAGTVDDAISAAEQAIVGPKIEPPDSNAALDRPSLIADQQFYGDQAANAQATLRTNAFLQGEGATPLAPNDAFAQRQAQIDAQADAARTAAFDQAQRDQMTQQAEQAPAITEAQGFNEPTPTQLSGAMGAEIQRLGNRNLNNLTTTQLAAVAAHHPDPEIQANAAAIGAGRRNAGIVSDFPKVTSLASTGEMEPHGLPQPIEFSQERGALTSDEDQTTQPADEVTPAAPTPHTSLADTAPQLLPLKAALDSDARARGAVNADTGFQPVDVQSLPKQRVPAENGVAGATTLSQDDANLLQKSADIYGKKVVLFHQDGDVAGRSLDGAILPSDPKTIYVNADASGAHHLVVFGHELAHQMQTEAPDLYKGMQDALMAHAKDGSLGDFAKYYGNDPTAEIGDDDTKQRMTDEFIADLVGNRAGEYKTWQSIFTSMAGSDNKSLVYRVADFIRQFIGKLLGNEKFKGFATDDMVNNLNDVRSSIRRALGDYAVQINAKPMQHEADQLRATAENKRADTVPTKFVEPVKAETGIPVSKAAPAPVAPREPEPSQGARNRIAESPERAPADTPTPETIESEDDFINRINPDGTRIPDAARPTVYAGDLDGMAPDAAKVMPREFYTTPEGNRVGFFKDPDTGAIYAKVNGHEVGYMMPADEGKSSDLAVAKEYQNEGVGARLSQLYREGNPDAPSGGLTAAGEAAARAAYRATHPVDEGTAESNPLSSDPAVRASGERAMYLGDLTAAQAAAARAVGGIQTKASYKDKINELKQDLGKKLVQGIADQFAPLKAISEKAYVEARMSKGADGALEALMLYGKPFLRDGLYDVDVHDTGFAKTMSALDGEHGRFFLWVAAQRAERLAAEGKENLFTKSDISALKTLDQPDAQHPDRAPKFAKALTDLNAFNDGVLKIAEESGLLDPATRQLFKDQPYVPFYRVMDEGDGMQGPGKSAGLVNQYAFKKLKGGTNQLNQDLLANTLANWGHLFGAAARNRAAQTTMDAAVKLGAADKVSAVDAGKGSFKVMENGKAQYYEVADPHLLAAVSAMSSQVPKWMRPLAEFKRLLTMGTTLAPGFRVRNLIRDTLTVMGTSDIKLNPIANLAQGFKATDHHSQTFASMLASGGIIQFGSMLEGNEAARAHRLIRSGVDSATILDNEGAINAMWGKAKEAADWYHEVGNRFENANRAALYEQLMAKGATHAEASFQSRDLMDFSLQGQNPVVRFLTTSVPFLNARIQGAYKLGRAVGTHPQRAATVMGAVAMASLALMLKYKDDPDWKNRPDWDRDNYWWFKIGDTAFRIPKPFEVGAVGTLAERSWEKMTDPEMTNARYVGEIRDVLFNQFNLNPTPQIVRPLLNVYANKDDFTGNQIENTSLQSLQPEDRYTPYTSMTSRFLGSLGLPDPIQLMLGRYSKLSPVQMDSLVNGYFGWLGTSTLSAADAVVRPLTNTGAKPALTLKDMTMGFADSLPANASRYSDTMYDNLNAINQAYASYHAALQSGQFEKAKDIMATNHLLGPSNKTLIQEHGMSSEMAAAESHLSLQERRVLDSPTLSSDTKRAMITRINQQRNRIAEAASDAELHHRLSQ